MKVIDLGPQRPKGSTFEALVFDVQKTTKDVLGLNQDIKAQEAISTQLGRTLNNRFTLVRNFRLDEMDIPIPLILIGPTGLFVICTSPVKGIFQAKNENWLAVSKSNRYEPAHPNLITRTSLMAQAVETYLKKKNIEVPNIQGALFFSNPGTHVDAQRPAVRIVLMDGIERFAISLLQGDLAYEREDVQNIIAALTGQGGPEKVLPPSLDEMTPP